MLDYIYHHLYSSDVPDRKAGKKKQPPRNLQDTVIKYFLSSLLKKNKWKQLESSDSFTAWPILQTPTII